MFAGEWTWTVPDQEKQSIILDDATFIVMGVDWWY